MSAMAHDVDLESALIQLELELYRRMHADWLLTPFAVHANILLVDMASRKLSVHRTWRLQTVAGIELPETIAFGEGVSGRAVLEDHLIYEPDIRNLPPSQYYSIISDTKSNLAILAKNQQEQLVAVVNTESPRLNAFDHLEDQALFAAYANLVAQQVETADPHEVDRVQSYLEVSIELAYMLEQFLRPIYRAIRTLDSKHQINLFLNDPEREELVPYQTGYFYRIERDVRMIPYGQGVTGQAAVHRKPIYIADTRKKTAPDYIELTKRTRSNFAVPVFSSEKLIAVVNIENPEVNAFRDHEQRLIERYCMLAAPAIQTARRLHLEEQNRHFTHALQDLTQQLVIQPSRRQLCDLVVQKAVELTGAAFGSLQIFERATNQLLMMSVWPPAERGRFTREPIPRGKGVTGRVVEPPYKPVWIPNVHLCNDYIPTLPGIQTELAVPLLSKNKELEGILNVEWSSMARPSERQAVRQLTALANLAVIGLSIAQAGESIGDLVHLGRDKLAVIFQFANQIVHDSLQKITSAQVILRDAQRNINKAGTRIEKGFLTLRPSTRAAARRRLKEDVLDMLFEADMSQSQALQRLMDFRHEWDEFKRKAEALNIENHANAVPRISIKSAVRKAVEAATARSTLHPSISVRILIEPELRETPQGASLVMILEHLVNNACEAMPDGGELTITARRWTDDPTFVDIRVSDTGPGVPDEIRLKIFQPLFRSGKSSRSNTGLGLFLARAMAEASSGRLDLIDDKSKRGAVFALRLPLDIG